VSSNLLSHMHLMCRVTFLAADALILGCPFTARRKARARGMPEGNKREETPRGRARLARLWRVADILRTRAFLSSRSAIISRASESSNLSLMLPNFREPRNRSIERESPIERQARLNSYARACARARARSILSKDFASLWRNAVLSHPLALGEPLSETTPVRLLPPPLLPPSLFSLSLSRSLLRATYSDWSAWRYFTVRGTFRKKWPARCIQSACLC
jgi:hypothetical protein